MYNQLTEFNSNKYGNVRTLEIDNNPWFVGYDISKALGYVKPTNAIKDHVDNRDKKTISLQTNGGIQNVIIINESGLYSLVFSSKLDSAKEFVHWITSEVIPKIRRTGIYIPDEYLTDKDKLTEALQAYADNKNIEWLKPLELTAPKKKSLTISEIAARGFYSKALYEPLWKFIILEDGFQYIDCQPIDESRFILDKKHNIKLKGSTLDCKALARIIYHLVEGTIIVPDNSGKQKKLLMFEMVGDNPHLLTDDELYRFYTTFEQSMYQIRDEVLVSEKLRNRKCIGCFTDCGEKFEVTLGRYMREVCTFLNKYDMTVMQKIMPEVIYCITR